MRSDALPGVRGLPAPAGYPGAAAAGSNQQVPPLAIQTGADTQQQETLAKLMDEVAYLRTQVDTLAASGVTPQKKAPSREGTPRDSGRKASLASSVGNHSFKGTTAHLPDVEFEVDCDSYFEVVDAQPHKSDDGFPNSLGPFGFFQTQRIKAEDLDVAFDDSDGGVCQWKLNSRFKLPPGSGTPEPGCMSPLEQINLVEGARRALGIPDLAKYFAWFHPIFPRMTAHSFEADLKFLKNGGYVYFDEGGTPLHICAVELDLGGALGFGKRQPLPASWTTYLWKQGRFQPVPQENIKCKGGTHYAWVMCDEEHDGFKLCPKGGFAYHFAGGKQKDSTYGNEDKDA